MNNQEIDAKLGAFHSWLTAEIAGYRALCEDGSYAVGDAWVDGESDRDIAIILDSPSSEKMTSIQSYLTKSSLPDECFFTAKSTEKFLSSNKGDTHDLSLKFRGRTLLGEDLVQKKEMPPTELADKLALQKLGGIEGKMQRRLLNASFWSTAHLRTKTYPIFKNLFLGLAARRYGESGVFPRKRSDVVEAYKDLPDLRKILKVLENIRTATIAEIVEALEVATGIIRLLAVSRDQQRNPSDEGL